MKTGETLWLEIRVLGDGVIQARRKDMHPLTETDHRDAIKWIDSTRGITATDVLRVIPGAIVLGKGIKDCMAEGDDFKYR
jgi:hypothetical protein